MKKSHNVESFLVCIKLETVCKDIAKDVETKFDNSDQKTKDI